MKRTLGIAIGLATIGAGVCLSSLLFAQTAPPTGTAPAPVAAPRTPMRIINLQYCVKNYNRWLNFQNEYKALYKNTYEDKILEKKKRMEAVALKLQDVKTAPAEREMLDKDARKLQREMQEISDEAKQSLGKREADMIVIIYKEVEDAVRDYVRTSGVELVMHYNDATEEPELHSTQNIGRKISTGGCFPMTYTQGMDISNMILGILNHRVPKVAAPAGAGTTSAAPGSLPAPGGAAGQPARPIQPVSGTVPPRN